MERDPLDARSVPLAERCQRQLVSVFCTSDKDWVGKLLIDERPVRPEVPDDST
jgi:hypothetical protein